MQPDQFHHCITGSFPIIIFGESDKAMEGDSTVHKIEEIVLEYFHQLSGESPLDLEDFLKQFPDLSEEDKESIKERVSLLSNETDFSDALLLEDTDQSVLEPTKTLPPFRGGSTPKPVPPDEPLELGTIGDYELLEQIGRGGMGIVYKARQISLNRIVALKIIRAKADDQSGVKRLRQEAHAAGKLHHPNIVPIYAFGEVDGKHFFTMQFVDGPSLAQLIQKGPLSPLIAAQYVRTMSRTIAYSHEQNIVHRDLKPSNVLIDQWGQPCITDFGVARPISENDEEENSGYITGTPNYMAPEQSRSSDPRIVPASDIYSLGAVLYALLTGRPPFKSATIVDTLLKVRNQAPVPPRLLNHAIPPDLETICLKCLEKETYSRYLSAEELAIDLNHFILGEPILARPAGRTERFWRWCQRNPAISLSALASAVMTILLIGVLLYSNIQLQKSARQLEDARQNAIASRKAAEYAVYLSDLKDAGIAWEERDSQQLSQYLKRQIPAPGGNDLRDGAWYFLWNHAHLPHNIIAKDPTPIYFVCFNKDGTALATSGKDAIIRIYDTSTVDYELLQEIHTQQIEVNGLAFSPIRDQLASAGDDGTVRIWNIDWENNKHILHKQFKAHNELALNVLFSQAGDKIYSAGKENVIRIWNAQTGDPEGKLDQHTDIAGSIALSPDGKLLASASNNSQIIIWDLLTQTPKLAIDARKGKLTSIAFSPDGKKVISTSTHEKVALMYDVKTGKLIDEIPHLNPPRRSMFSPDGQKVITSDYSGMIHFWPVSLKNRQEPRWKSTGPHSWKAHDGRVFSMAFSPQNRSLTSGGGDFKVISWDIESKPPTWFLQKADHDFSDIQFVSTTEGEKIVSLDNNVLELWNIEDGTLNQELKSFKTEINCLGTARGHAMIAAGADDGHIYVIDAENGKEIFSKQIGKQFDTDQILLSSDGRLLAAVNTYGDHPTKLVVFDILENTQLQNIPPHEYKAIAFSQDCKRLYASIDTNEVKILDMENQSDLKGPGGHFDSINQITCSPDDKIIATCSKDRLVKLWQKDSFSAATVLSQHKDEVISMVFDSKGSKLISCGLDGKVIVWNVGTAQRLFEIDYEQADPMRVCFSEDDRYLACLINDDSGKSSRGYIQIMKWNTAEE